MRKLKIILFILIVITLIFIAWLIFARSNGNELIPIREEAISSDQESSSVTNTSKLKRIQDTQRTLIGKTAESKLITANANQRDSVATLALINLKEGTEEVVTITPIFEALSSLDFSDPDRILLKTSLLGESNSYIFSSSSASWIKLDSEIDSAALSPNGEEFAAFKNGTGVEVFDYLSQSSVSSIDLALLDFDIFWPTQESIILVSRPSYQSHGYLIKLNLATNLLEIIAEGSGLMANFSEDLEKFLVLTNADDAKPGKLILVNSDKSEIELSFITLPQKCSFASSSILYCAVPVNNSLGLDYPDSYLQKEIFTSDEFLKIEILDSSIRSEIILAPNSEIPNIDAINLEFLDGKLYFINKYDSQLYELSL